MRPLYILLLALVLVLASCGKSSSTANVTKEQSTSVPINTSATPATPPADVKAPDTEKKGIEAAGLYEAKYCNYKVGALQLQINAKKSALDVLKDQKDASAAIKEEQTKAEAELQDLQKQMAGLQDTCKQSKFGSSCDAFNKDIDMNIAQVQTEGADDKDSLQKWQAKLDSAKSSNKLMDITIAKAKVDKLAARVLTEDNQVKAFTAMKEDLKGFC